MRTRLIIATTAASLLALTACGGGESAGDKDAFCELGSDMSAEPTDETIDALLASAPGEIRDEVELMTDTLRKINELEAMEEPDEELAAEIEETASSDEYAKALEALDRYAEKECGIDTDE